MPNRGGQCHGVGLGVTPTNLFGKNTYKEALTGSQDMVKEYAQEISTLKASTVELMKRLEAMEKEHVVRNQSVSIKYLSLVSIYIFTQ